MAGTYHTEQEYPEDGGCGGRLRQLGCRIAQGNHFLIWATMINIIFARLGKYKSEVSLHQSYQSSYKIIS